MRTSLLQMFYITALVAVALTIFQRPISNIPPVGEWWDWQTCIYPFHGWFWLVGYDTPLWEPWVGKVEMLGQDGAGQPKKEVSFLIGGVAFTLINLGLLFFFVFVHALIWDRMSPKQKYVSDYQI